MVKCRKSWPESVTPKLKDCTGILQVVQISYAWRSDSKITFKSFANGIKVDSRNSASENYEMYSKLISLTQLWSLLRPPQIVESTESA